MLGWVRNQSAKLARVLLLSLLAAGASEAMPSHAEAGHDDHSLTAVGSTVASGLHSETDHELRADDSPDAAHPLHCLVCHWARAFRPLASPSAEVTPTLEARYHVQLSVISAPRSVAPAQLSLRSPPVSPSVAPSEL